MPALDSCDVLIVGGGPAGSTCAWKLRRAGLDVVVLDRAVFPRDKVCGGWITPQAVADLELDLEDYRQTRTLQAIGGFRTGAIGGRRQIETTYGRVVSYGIRRCEFDDYLLRRSAARQKCGEAVGGIRYDGERWVVNGITAPMLVGAGGHFCPVARQLNDGLEQRADWPLVVAQEVEWAVEPAATAQLSVRPDIPELYFCRDLRGYGWCFRKQEYINIGLGRADRHSLPAATAEFIEFLERRGKVPPARSWRWRGHAYLLQGAVCRRAVGEGVMLIGDAAGLAYQKSGEGIRPAIESGLAAASTILDAGGDYTRERLKPYENFLARQPGGARRTHLLSSRVASSAIASSTTAARLLTPIANLLLQTPPFVRHVALDRWFLHAEVPPLAAA